MFNVSATKDNITNYKLYSFDVFDTLISRKTAMPTGIFIIVQNELIQNSYYNDISTYVRHNFYEIRIQAERYIRNVLVQDGIKEITFNDIYHVIGYNNNLTDKQVDKLKELEITTEIQNLIPINENINKIKEYLHNKKKVILISDMYYSSEIIRKLLVSVDNIFSDIPIYVSSELQAAKHSKDIYEKLSEILTIDKSEWVHYGDNIHADVNNANLLGIKGKLFEFPGLYSYEFQLLNKINNPIVQYSIGASKFCRINKLTNSQYCLGCSYAAPIFFSYIYWLLQQTIERDIRRLYFVARDGFVLKHIADVIINKQNLPIKTYYIYGSRDAWRIASITNKETMNALFNCVRIANYEDLSHVTHIQQEELKQLLPNFKFNTFDKSIFMNNNNFVNKVFNQAKKERKNVIGYLKQEIDISDDKFAFVEYQGTGVTQDCLNRLMKSFYDKDISTFYLSLDNRNQFNKQSIKYIYYPNNIGGFYLAEVLLRANHGSTKGYVYKNNKYIPIFDSIEGDALQKWNYKEYIKGIIDYASTLLNFINNNDCLLQGDISRFYIQILKSGNDNVLKEVIGSIPFSTNYGSGILIEYAPKISVKKAIEISYLGEQYNGTHFEMSLNRSKTIIRKIFKFKNKYPDLSKFFYDADINHKKNIAYIRILGIKISLRRLLWR